MPNAEEMQPKKFHELSPEDKERVIQLATVLEILEQSGVDKYRVLATFPRV